VVRLGSLQGCNAIDLDDNMCSLFFDEQQWLGIPPEGECSVFYPRMRIASLITCLRPNREKLVMSGLQVV
jgi:hypothetical protein